VLLPALGQVAGDPAGELGVLLGVLVAVALEEGVPLVVLGLAVGRELGVKLLGRVGHGKLLLRVEAKLLLDRDNVVGLEGRAVDAVRALDLGAKADRRRQPDEGRLARRLGLGDGGRDGREVRVAVGDVDVLPAVGLEALLDVFGKRDVGVAVDRDVVVLQKEGVGGPEVSL
jgi:hypothetical protein